MSMRMRVLALACLLTAGGQSAADGYGYGPSYPNDYQWSHRPATSFKRIATFANYRNNAERDAETVSEIVAATKDGMLLVYTDSPMGQVGLVDITDPADPQPLGKLDVGGEPTSVDVLGNRYALVAVNTSESFTNPGGMLVVIDLATRGIVAEHDLGGQPDSLKISADLRYAAIAIENERDEDIEVDGVEGGLPQLPAGYLVIMDLEGEPALWTRRDVDLTGLAEYAPEDPEPEFVDINEHNEVVVSLQENNHAIVVDLEDGRIVDDFPMGTVDLDGVDANEDGVISLTDSLSDVPREPDAVAWVPGSGYRNALIATANEGDLFGGSRGFSLFNHYGELRFDSAETLEAIAVRHGHYPEDRSENKGSEPESIEYGRFGDRDYLFVGSERGSFVAVYEMLGQRPQFRQLLAAPMGPEGLLAIPSRGLLVASGEEDDPEFGVRSTMMIYRLGRGAPTYPQIVSANDDEGAPIAWSALSGMVGIPNAGDTLLAVWDSYYSESRILTIDASRKPAVITESLAIVGGSGDYDPEGIAIAPDGSYWIASEGNASDARPNRLLQVDEFGNVVREVGLPQAILDCRAASENRGTLGSGFEGVAAVPTREGYVLAVAQQRGWDYTTSECEDLDDDAGGLNAKGEPNRSRIWLFDPKSGDWSHVGWELAALPENASWVGLSEITRTPQNGFIVIERDNRTGDFAELKTLVNFRPMAALDGLISQDEKRVFDLLPALRASNGWVSDKPEGVAISARGRTYVVTDNDGVEDWSGETWFLDLGGYAALFY